MAEAVNDKIVLSDEHSDFVWVSYEEIDSLDNVIYKELFKEYVTDAEEYVKNHRN